MNELIEALRDYNKAIGWEHYISFNDAQQFGLFTYYTDREIIDPLTQGEMIDYLKTQSKTIKDKATKAEIKKLAELVSSKYYSDRDLSLSECVEEAYREIVSKGTSERGKRTE